MRMMVELDSAIMLPSLSANSVSKIAQMLPRRLEQLLRTEVAVTGSVPEIGEWTIICWPA